MELALGLIFFWLGAIFASFAGAVAWRIYKQKDFVSDRSECERCHHKLSAFDLVPIFSWLWLRGKCRYCRKKIGAGSLVTEILFGLAFAASYCLWPFGFATILSLVMFGLWLLILVFLAILFVYDLRWYFLPDKLTLPLIVLASVFFILRMLQTDTQLTQWFLEAFYGLIPVAGVYGLLYVVSKEKWVGLGDAKLGIAIGLVLGWQGAFLTLFMSNVLGLLYVLPGLLHKKIGWKERVPFGPFLIIATVIVFLCGKAIIDAYLSLQWYGYGIMIFP